MPSVTPRDGVDHHLPLELPRHPNGEAPGPARRTRAIKPLRRNASEFDLKKNHSLILFFWAMMIGTFWCVTLCGYLSPYNGFHKALIVLRSYFNPHLAAFYAANDEGWGLGAGPLAGTPEAQREYWFLITWTVVGSLVTVCAVQPMLFAAFFLSFLRTDATWRVLHQEPSPQVPCCGPNDPQSMQLLQEYKDARLAVDRQLRRREEQWREEIKAAFMQKEPDNNNNDNSNNNDGYRKSKLEDKDVPWLTASLLPILDNPKYEIYRHGGRPYRRRGRSSKHQHQQQQQQQQEQQQQQQQEKDYIESPECMRLPLAEGIEPPSPRAAAAAAAAAAQQREKEERNERIKREVLAQNEAEDLIAAKLGFKTRLGQPVGAPPLGGPSLGAPLFGPSSSFPFFWISATRFFLSPFITLIRLTRRGAHLVYVDFLGGGPLISEVLEGAAEDEEGCEGMGVRKGMPHFLALDALRNRSRALKMQHRVARALLLRAGQQQQQQQQQHQFHRTRDPEYMQKNPHFPYFTHRRAVLSTLLYIIALAPLATTAALTSALIGGFSNYYAVGSSSPKVLFPVLGIQIFIYLIVDAICTAAALCMRKVNWGFMPVDPNAPRPLGNNNTPGGPLEDEEGAPSEEKEGPPEQKAGAPKEERKGLLKRGGPRPSGGAPAARRSVSFAVGVEGGNSEKREGRAPPARKSRFRLFMEELALGAPLERGPSEWKIERPFPRRPSSGEESDEWFVRGSSSAKTSWGVPQKGPPPQEALFKDPIEGPLFDEPIDGPFPKGPPPRGPPSEGSLSEGRSSRGPLRGPPEGPPATAEPLGDLERQQQEADEGGPPSLGPPGFYCSTCSGEILPGSCYVCPSIIGSTVFPGGPLFSFNKGSGPCMHAQHLQCYFSSFTPWCGTCLAVYREGQRPWSVWAAPRILGSALEGFAAAGRWYRKYKEGKEKERERRYDAQPIHVSQRP